MKSIIAGLSLIICFAFTTGDMNSIHQFTVKTLEGKDFSFASLKGKKILIVNTASECGYTVQYKDLEALYKKYQNRNFTIIGFPCNDFGGQEPGTAKDIQSFCSKNYGVTFPLMEKISIKGEHTHPVYKWLTTKALNGLSDSEVKWNFNKYLINGNGKLVKHLDSKVLPMDKEITDWIEN